MENDRFLSEVELAHRWSISTKTLQRWRAGKRGLPYAKLSRTVRYDFHDVITYEQTQRRTSPVTDELPRSGPGSSTPQSGSEATMPEPKRYSLKDALELIARYGSLRAAEAAMSENAEDTRR